MDLKRTTNCKIKSLQNFWLILLIGPCIVEGYDYSLIRKFPSEYFVEHILPSPELSLSLSSVNQRKRNALHGLDCIQPTTGKNQNSLFSELLSHIHIKQGFKFKFIYSRNMIRQHGSYSHF